MDQNYTNSSNTTPEESSSFIEQENEIRLLGNFTSETIQSKDISMPVSNGSVIV